MKKQTFILIITFLITITSFCKNNSDKAMEYNSIIASDLNLLTEIEKEISLKDGPELDIAIEKFKKQVPESRQKIEKLGSFENDDSIQKAALEICNFYQEVIDGKWSDKGQKVIQDKDAELDDKLLKVQMEFAKKYKFEIKK
ncbi:MAG: hypothetical protein IPL26_24640 [Leptospiraceae bacterium]|nr:hypothetical protein [Leptospiraceae bacterium]